MIVFMNYGAYTEKIKTLVYYISKQWAQTPAGLAQKLDVSERTVFRMIAMLKEQGNAIYYCKKSKKYLMKKTD
jgi:predicted DNA-binding transcriptional regulator YafY